MKRNELFSSLEQSMVIIGKEIYQEQLGVSNSSPAQNHVLMLVSVNGPIGVKQLAEKLRVTSGAATQHVDALEKAGLLSRHMSPNDRREVLIEATNKGKDLSIEIRNAKAKMLSKLFSELDDNELNTLVGLIEKVSKKYITKKGDVK
jgi:DNA-binding MarR family transcriptional regulator